MGLSISSWRSHPSPEELTAQAEDAQRRVSPHAARQRPKEFDFRSSWKREDSQLSHLPRACCLTSERPPPHLRPFGGRTKPLHPQPEDGQSPRPAATCCKGTSLTLPGSCPPASPLLCRSLSRDRRGRAGEDAWAPEAFDLRRTRAVTRWRAQPSPPEPQPGIVWAGKIQVFEEKGVGEGRSLPGCQIQLSRRRDSPSPARTHQSS